MVVITTELVDVNILVDTNNPNVGMCYSIMQGNSPFFTSFKEVEDYYNALPIAKRATHLVFEHNLPKFLVVYVHFVSKRVHDCGHSPRFSYVAKQGEILSTDEAGVYDFQLKRWL